MSNENSKLAPSSLFQHSLHPPTHKLGELSIESLSQAPTRPLFAPSPPADRIPRQKSKQTRLGQKVAPTRFGQKVAPTRLGQKVAPTRLGQKVAKTRGGSSPSKSTPKEAGGYDGLEQIPFHDEDSSDDGACPPLLPRRPDNDSSDSEPERSTPKKSQKRTASSRADRRNHKRFHDAI